MNEEILISIIMFFTFTIILINQLMITKISRKNIFLGVRIPESKLDSVEIKDIHRDYLSKSLIIGIVSLLVLVYIIYRSQNLAFIVLSSLVYPLILFLVYLRSNKKVKDLKARENWMEFSSSKKIVNIQLGKKEPLFPGYLLLIPAFILIFNIFISFYSYPSLPDKIAFHWNFEGQVDAYKDKSLLTVNFINISQAVVLITMIFGYFSMVKSKGELDPKNPEESLRHNRIFKKAWALYFLLSTIFLQLIFSLLNTASLGIITDIRLVNIMTLVGSLVLVIMTLIIGLTIGQGGDRLKKHSGESFIEDDDKWILGNTIYYNSDDPNLFVEKRIGIGWTVNMAKPLGLTLLALPIFIILIIALFI